MSRPYQVLNTLFNLHLYFKQNSEYDNFDKTKTISWAKENKLLTSPDIWLLSKLQKLIKKTTERNETCKFHEAAKAVDDFIINNLSQIYIPITRGELWDEEESKKNRRLAIYAVLKDVLKTLDILIHPLCPFTSEYLYQTVFDGKKSILLDKWPQYQEILVNEEMEESFDIMKDVVSISSAARMKEKLKRRWPLNEALICVSKGQKQRLQTLRKERGHNPTDILSVASILDLDDESLEMIKEKSEELAFLVRVKQVNFTESCKEYKDDDIDGQKIRISVE